MTSLLFRMLLLWAVVASNVWGESDRAPNVLLILVDDLGWPDISAHGSEEVLTPHIDSIGDRGVRFTSGYVTAPQCSPARAGLLTGRYQTRLGHDNNNYLHACFADEQLTIADALQDEGYITGAFGKWHLGFFDHEHPQEQGFDHFWGFLHGGHAYLGERWQDSDTPFFHGRQELAKPDAFLTDTIAGESMAFMTENQRRPWFAYVAFNAPHSPLQMPPGYEERVAGIEDVARARFVAMMMNLDDAIGRMLARLKETGQGENTLVVFLSDNGGQPHANASVNLPFRGNKGDVYEGGVRIPFMLQWPAVIPSGQVVDYPVTSLDILPTALAAAGRSEFSIDEPAGVDLLPYLRQRLNLAPRPLFWRWSGQTALRLGDLKWVQYPDRAPELYDLHLDPYETRDLAAIHPTKEKELEKIFRDWDAGNPELNETHRDNRQRPQRPLK